MKETVEDKARSTHVFCVGRTHYRHRRLDDTSQSAQKMVPKNDRGVSDCRKSL